MIRREPGLTAHRERRTVPEASRVANAEPFSRLLHKVLYAPRRRFADLLSEDVSRLENRFGFCMAPFVPPPTTPV